MNQSEIALVASAVQRAGSLSFDEQLAVIAALDFCRTAAATPAFAVQYGTVAQKILTRG